jgi:hypothetical protein
VWPVAVWSAVVRWCQWTPVGRPRMRTVVLSAWMLCRWLWGRGMVEFGGCVAVLGSYKGEEVGGAAGRGSTDREDSGLAGGRIAVLPRTDLDRGLGHAWWFCGRGSAPRLVSAVVVGQLLVMAMPNGSWTRTAWMVARISVRRAAGWRVGWG